MYVDMHSHILPGADHGSESVEMSLSQLYMAKQEGIDTVLSTSHFYMENDNVEDFLRRRRASYEQLKSAMPEDLAKDIKIILGAEVTLYSGLDKLEGLEKLCIGKTRNILIEMPMIKWNSTVYETLDNLIKIRGLNPIIAHVDRYVGFNTLDTLLNMDVSFQVNASAFESFTLRYKMINLFKYGYAMYLGSDIHLLGNQYKQYTNAVKKLGPLMETVTENSRYAVGQIKEEEDFTVKRFFF